uniref:uncharacterized protein LOC122590831 n=1 Tax=Erigeron canadensis TaxID=72917 RepID=UPI001CB93D53|nr:uncharacterized protein LOC122590831 [Erigeron canadensis]
MVPIFSFGRQPFLVPKHGDNVKKADLEIRNLEHKLKGKEVFSFSVKPKAGTRVVPQVSNTPGYRWTNKASDGSKQMLSKAQPGISVKPTMKTIIGIPKTQKASNICQREEICFVQEGG